MKKRNTANVNNFCICRDVGNRSKETEQNCEMQRATEMEKSSHKQWWLPGPNLCSIPSSWAVVGILLITAGGEQVLTPEQQCILRAVMTQHRGDGG